jgi:hypothetical protein
MSGDDHQPRRGIARRADAPGGSGGEGQSGAVAQMRLEQLELIGKRFRCRGGPKLERG